MRTLSEEHEKRNPRPNLHFYYREGPTLASKLGSAVNKSPTPGLPIALTSSLVARAEVGLSTTCTRSGKGGGAGGPRLPQGWGCSCPPGLGAGAGNTC